MGADRASGHVGFYPAGSSLSSRVPPCGTNSLTLPVRPDIPDEANPSGEADPCVKEGNNSNEEQKEACQEEQKELEEKEDCQAKPEESNSESQQMIDVFNE